MQRNPLNIESISLISSCGCNLKCAYCVIAQSANEHTSTLQAKTIQAFEDGSFLKNVVNSLLVLNQSPGRIKRFSLWGQEPTLTLHHLTNQWDKWQQSFPNIGQIFFSTNGMAHGDRIADFIKKVDSCATSKINLQIQVSYDGEFSTNNIRNANSIKIQENIKNIILDLNNYKLKNIDVSFCFHGVMSQSLIDTLVDGKTTQDYFNAAYKWTEELVELNTNRNVFVELGVGYVLESPIDATVEQGINLAAFCKKMIKVNPKYVENILGNVEAHSIIGSYQRAFRGFGPYQAHSFKDVIRAISTNKEEMRNFLEFFSRNSFCGTFYGEVKFMYDGTIITCQNNMYEKDKSTITRDGSITNESKYALANHQLFFVNPLEDTPEHIYTVFDIFKTARESSFLFHFSNNVNLMLWLLECHQIDESYRDMEKLLSHGFYLTLLNSCVYNNYVKTGSVYGTSTGLVRYMCNGFLDCILNDDEVWGGPKRE